MKQGGPIQRKTGLRAQRATPRRSAPPAPRIKTRREEDPDYLAWVRTLPCICCRHEGRAQTGRTEAHHIRRKADGSTYGASQKAHDREAIPLCNDRHHWNGVHCASTLSHHAFESTYGNERDLLAETHTQPGMPPAHTGAAQ
jgi:hypothetical protein